MIPLSYLVTLNGFNITMVHLFFFLSFWVFVDGQHWCCQSIILTVVAGSIIFYLHFGVKQGFCGGANGVFVMVLVVTLGFHGGV